jgi:uncharacterized protein
MRVILDANVFLSYLLTPDSHGTITLIVETSLLADDITVLLPPELLRETADRAMNKPYFRGRVPRNHVEQVLAHLTTYAETLPDLEDEWKDLVRDRKDDYLVAYGLVHDADYLVTGDQDLLVLRQVHNLRIVTPVEYLQLIV